MSSPHRPSPRRWAALSAAALLGLACVALLLAGGRASAAPPDVSPQPPAALPGPQRLAPSAQLTPTICPLDVALVFDSSGSQEWDTICYDCWHETNNDILTYPYPANGTFYPISYSAVISYNLCAATSTPYIYGSYHYIIMEAELYARKDDVGWYRTSRGAGQGYWALQRGTTDITRSSSIDGNFAAAGSRSAHMAHNPYWTFGQISPPAARLGRFYTHQDAISDTAPRLEYDFTPDWSSPTHIWARVQGGGLQSFNNDPAAYTRNADKLYWAVDNGTPVQNDRAPTCDAVYDYAGCYLSTTIHDDRDCVSGGEDNCSTVWRWIYLGPVTVTSGTLHALKLWAGSSGYEVDKIVVTNDSDPNLNISTIKDVLRINNGRGRPATPGSARGGAPDERAGACDRCNPIYGLTVNPSDCTTPYYPVLTTTDRLQDDLFGDREPLRGSQEAAKRLVTTMNPQYDQAGFVGFHSSVSYEDQAELACLRRQTVLGDPVACYSGASPISYTNVLQTVERQVANGGTNIAEGLRNGLEVLGYDVDNRSIADNLCDGSLGSACGRGYAARPVLILMSNGLPTAHPSGPCGNYPDLWPNHHPDFTCAIYYALKASEAGVPIYTIGVGNDVMPEPLQAIADQTGGEFYLAPSAPDLDAVLDAIHASATASCSPFGLSMAADGAQTGLPGQSLVYTHVLTNRSYYPVTASLTYTVAPAGWPVSVSPVSQPLEPGQAVTVTAVVSVPPGSLEGAAGVVRLVAALHGDETISATVADTTTVGWPPPIYLPIVLSDSQVWTQK